MPDRALGLYDEALSLWRGDPFGEFADEWWALPESTRLRERHASADLGRAEARMAMGHHNRAIPDLERLAAERPLDERPVTLLMQALLATGRQAESMRVARAFRDRLGEQTGLEPSAQLARLETAVATGADAPPPPVGRPLRGYTLHEAIGEGAHGRVYAATQPGTERPVAVKVIRPDLADSTAFVVRFEAEARLIARLEHPHIVPLYDAWREPGGAFLVFRLLGGGTLRDSIISGGPWSLPRASRLVEEVGGALIAAHAAGVIHNDVKSSNVLLDDAGAAYLGDFGIAVAAERSGRRAAQRRGGRRRVTSAGCCGRCSPASARRCRASSAGCDRCPTDWTRCCGGRRTAATSRWPNWCSVGAPRSVTSATARRRCGPTSAGSSTRPAGPRRGSWR